MIIGASLISIFISLFLSLEPRIQPFEDLNLVVSELEVSVYESVFLKVSTNQLAVTCERDS